MTDIADLIEARFQFVWHWRWMFYFREVDGPLAQIYRWAAMFGPLEIRRWRLNRSEFRAKKRELLATRNVKALNSKDTGNV